MPEGIDFYEFQSCLEKFLSLLRIIQGWKVIPGVNIVQKITLAIIFISLSCYQVCLTSFLEFYFSNWSIILEEHFFCVIKINLSPEVLKSFIFFIKKELKSVDILDSRSIKKLIMKRTTLTWAHTCFHIEYKTFPKNVDQKIFKINSRKYFHKFWHQILAFSVGCQFHAKVDFFYQKRWMHRLPS